MISPLELQSAGWTQDTREGVGDFWDRGILSYHLPTGDVIYTGREPYIEAAAKVTDLTELAKLSTWKPPPLRTSRQPVAPGI